MNRSLQDRTSPVTGQAQGGQQHIYARPAKPGCHIVVANLNRPNALEARQELH